MPVGVADPPTAQPGVSGDGTNQASGASGSGGESEDMLVITVIIAAALILLIIAVGLFIIKAHQAKTATATAARDAGGFDNPMYAGAHQFDLTDSGTDAGGNTGYMDVAPADSAGYMDVAPSAN